MEKENLDPRIVRTRISLRAALVSLMQNKTVSEISINELTEKAQVTRATFYQHYKDKNDFLEKTMNEMFEMYKEKVSTLSLLTYKDSIDRRSIVFFEHIGENSDFYRVMLGNNGVPAFREKMRQIGLEYFYHRYLPELLGENFDVTKLQFDFSIIANYVVSGQTGIVDHWLETDMKYSPKHLAKVISKFTYTLVKSFGLIEQDDIK